jgi:transposase-like protein
MEQNRISCIRSVGGEKICSYCEGNLIKYGKTKQQNQRFKCNNCNRTQVEKYRYNAYQLNLNQQIVLLTKEGLGIRSTARVLRISATTLLKRILSIANKIPRPFISKGKTYEVDELRTFIGNKKAAAIATALISGTVLIIPYFKFVY